MCTDWEEQNGAVRFTRKRLLKSLDVKTQKIEPIRPRQCYYAQIVNRILSVSGGTTEDIHAECSRRIPNDPTDSDWISAARTVLMLAEDRIMRAEYPKYFTHQASQSTS